MGAGRGPKMVVGWVLGMRVGVDGGWGGVPPPGGGKKMVLYGEVRRGYCVAI